MISVPSKNLVKRTFKYKESNCSIISDTEDAIKSAISSIKFHRKELEVYIQDHPVFLHSLKPVRVEHGPKVVELMAEAVKLTDVGPMAAVAGVLADLAVEEMLINGAEVAIVENGGEAFIVSNRNVDVALSAGDSPLSRRLGFRLEDFPIGVATSSGLYSHALSFGESEAVTIFAKNAGLADAVATAVGNIVKGEEVRDSIQGGIQKALSIEGVKGAFIIYRGMVGMGGETPQIIGVNITIQEEKLLDDRGM
jgi:ApbE superfamily uncharacterized protein (UPF0280 family)